ncbi:MAG: GNAT family N-acetyltransferase/peptidase C39 family protein [Rhodospirillales bacterium]|nr:GNAT family N-acetyltransferase/peptidase C39 family protein [Rhodospirillales bacterium]
MSDHQVAPGSPGDALKTPGEGVPAVRPTGSSHLGIRQAQLSDIDALVRIENNAFETDRLSARRFRYLLSKANALVLVATEDDDVALGYVMVLFNRGTSLARLYSIAVDAPVRGRGVGELLLQAAEAGARERDTACVRLEVRADDPSAQSFYRSHGYRQFAMHHHYYEDRADALRMEKSLAPRPDPGLARVPYYAQSLDFTCGPAAALMAMHALDPHIAVDQVGELRLWRESTTVFMTSGVGGCSPEGLALAIHRRGFHVEVFLSDTGTLFVDSVRSESKRAVIRLVQNDFRKQLAEAGIATVFRPLSVETMREKVEAGGIPLVLISSYRFDREKQPHWVVVTGFDEKYVYLHDPNVDEDLDKTATDCMQIPVLQRDFAKMARYGRSQLKAAVIVGKGRG